MKQLIHIILLLVPSFTWANFCPHAEPQVKKYQDQRQWEELQLSQDGIQLQVEGYIDGMNNFYPEGVSTRTEQKVILFADQENPEFKNFYQNCKKYDSNGIILTAFRRDSSTNKYRMKMRYLPELKEFNNTPFGEVKTHRFEVFVDFDSDSLIGRLPLAPMLKEEIRQEIANQLSDETPIGEYDITLTNWDDFACDLIQGKAKVNIVRDSYSEDTFVKMHEIVRKKDVFRVYDQWKDKLSKSQSRDDLMFAAGVVLESLRQENKIDQFDNRSAVKMVTKLVDKNEKELRDIGNQQLACLSDSLQDYRSEYTQYSYNVIFDVDKDLSLKTGE